MGTKKNEDKLEDIKKGNGFDENIADIINDELSSDQDDEQANLADLLDAVKLRINTRMKAVVKGWDNEDKDKE